MKTIEILAVGLRLVGIYGILKGIQNAAMAYSSFPDYHAQFPDDNLYYFVSIGFVLAYFIGSAVLIAFPVPLARLLTPRTEKKDSNPLPIAGNFQSAALSVLGIYIVAHSLPMLFQHGLLAWQAFSMPEIYNERSARSQLVYTASRAIELSIGLYLSLQSAALVGLIHKIRALGMR